MKVTFGNKSTEVQCLILIRLYRDDPPSSDKDRFNWMKDLVRKGLVKKLSNSWGDWVLTEKGENIARILDSVLDPV